MTKEMFDEMFSKFTFLQKLLADEILLGYYKSCCSDKDVEDGYEEVAKFLSKCNVLDER